MRNPKLKIHGPEHHFLVPAVLLSSYYNVKRDYEEKENKIREATNFLSENFGVIMNIFTIIGLAAATCTTFSFLPQAIKVIKTKHTKDLSLAMYSTFTTGVFLWLVYGILIKDTPLIIANIITFIFAATILIMKIRYK